MMSRQLTGEGLLVYIVVLVGWGDWLFVCACSHNVRCRMSSVVCATPSTCKQLDDVHMPKHA